MGYSLEGNLAYIGSISLSMCNKQKKCRRASSRAVQGSSPNACGPKVAGAACRAKRKQVQKAGSLDANPSSPEETFKNTTQEGRDPDMVSCIFAQNSVQCFSDEICNLSKVLTTI
jgi:hypothetical protein